MKQSPKEKLIQQKLEEGVLSKSGFLGSDSRTYQQIIEADSQILQERGYDTKTIANKMKELTKRSFEAYDDSIILDDKYEIEHQSFRGKIVCPFAHAGIYPKALIRVKNLKNGKICSWTPLLIHLIEEHTFFEGKGSESRLEPSLLIDVLFH